MAAFTAPSWSVVSKKQEVGAPSVSGHTAVAAGDRSIIFGGRLPDATYSSAIAVRDHMQGSWVTSDTTGIEPRMYGAAAVARCERARWITVIVPP